MTTLPILERDVGRLFKRLDPCRAAQPDAASPSTLCWSASSLQSSQASLTFHWRYATYEPTERPLPSPLSPQKTSTTALIDYWPITLISGCPAVHPQLVCKGSSKHGPPLHPQYLDSSGSKTRICSWILSSTSWLQVAYRLPGSL